jgi:hypothetical protein
MSAPRRAVNHPSFTAVRVKSPCRVESRRPSASCAVRTAALLHRCSAAAHANAAKLGPGTAFVAIRVYHVPTTNYDHVNTTYAVRSWADIYTASAWTDALYLKSLIRALSCSVCLLPCYACSAMPALFCLLCSVLLCFALLCSMYIFASQGPFVLASMCPIVQLCLPHIPSLRAALLALRFAFTFDKWRVLYRLLLWSVSA